MTSENKVMWHEGMFLRVQHFQQFERWSERLIRMSSRMLSSFSWGLTSLEIDRAALGIGQLKLSSASGILPDGTVFETPLDCNLPAPLLFDSSVNNCEIYIGAPLVGAANIPQRSQTARFDTVSYNAIDVTADQELSSSIDVGRLNLKLLQAGDDLTGYSALGIARVSEVRSDQTVILDTSYIAPSLNCATGVVLDGIVNELVGLIQHRAHAISARLGIGGPAHVAELADHFLLQILNRNQPLLAHLRNNLNRIHPISLYEYCIQLAGELSTFTGNREAIVELPRYDHSNLSATFHPWVFELRRSLSVVLEQTATTIELRPERHGIFVGTIHDRSLFNQPYFVLAIRCDLAAEELRRTVPNRIKVSAVDRITELVNVALSGISVAPLPVAPRQLPYQTGTVYFELNTKDSLWTEVTTTGGIAFHLAGEYPGLSMELWALRD